MLFLSVLCLSCNEEEGPSGNDTPAKIDTPVKVLPPITHYTVPDNSPMDMVYFPGDYPLLKMAEKTSSPPLMRIIYSRPQKQNRQWKLPVDIINSKTKTGSMRPKIRT